MQAAQTTVKKTPSTESSIRTTHSTSKATAGKVRRVTLFRLVLTFAVVGTLLGILFATLGYPSYLSSELCGFGGASAALASPCKDTVERATSALIHAQINGGGLGAVVGIAGGVGFSIWRRRRAKKASDGGSTSSTPPPA